MSDGRVKAADFGIARLLVQRLPTLVTFLGLSIFSPEQASGDEADERSDIYSVA